MSVATDAPFLTQEKTADPFSPQGFTGHPSQSLIHRLTRERLAEQMSGFNLIDLKGGFCLLLETLLFLGTLFLLQAHWEGILWPARALALALTLFLYGWGLIFARVVLYITKYAYTPRVEYLFQNYVDYSEAYTEYQCLQSALDSIKHNEVIRSRKIWAINRLWRGIWVQVIWLGALLGLLLFHAL